MKTHYTCTQCNETLEWRSGFYRNNRGNSINQPCKKCMAGKYKQAKKNKEESKKETYYNVDEYRWFYAYNKRDSRGDKS